MENKTIDKRIVACYNILPKNLPSRVSIFILYNTMDSRGGKFYNLV